MQLMKLPEKIYYTSDHLWIEFIGDVALVGMTDFGQEELGEIICVEPGPVGECYNQNDVFGLVKTKNAISELSIPVKGEIIEVNPLIVNCPGIINDHPYTDGWIVKVRPADMYVTEDLYISEEYRFLVSPDLK